MIPAGVIAYGMKMAALWSTSVAAFYADLTLFDPRTLFGSVGAILIVFGTAALTVRSRAIQFWKSEADAATARAERMEKERDEQRELKHTALAETNALRLKTDIAPILEALAEVQKSLAERALDRDEITFALSGMKAALEAQTILLERLVATQEGG